MFLSPAVFPQPATEAKRHVAGCGAAGAMGLQVQAVEAQRVLAEDLALGVSG